MTKDSDQQNNTATQSGHTADKSRDESTTRIKRRGFTTQRPKMMSSGRKIIPGSKTVASTQVDTISLLLPGRDKPTVFRGKGVIVMGRRDDNNSYIPEVDLTDQFGGLMGVSRKHAEIVLEQGQFFLKDLGSTNGSWLNGRQLVAGKTYPLTNGDQIRLGELLMLVYVSSSRNPKSRAPRPTEDTCTVGLVDLSRSTDEFENGIPPTYLTNILSVYLHAIAEMQNLLRQARGEQPIHMSVQGIRKDDKTNAMYVEITHGTEIIDFLRDKLPRFVEARMLESGDNISDERLAVAGAKYMLEEQVFRFLGEERADYVRKIATHLRRILKSDLRFTLVNDQNTPDSNAAPPGV